MTVACAPPLIPSFSSEREASEVQGKGVGEDETVHVIALTTRIAQGDDLSKNS